MKKLTILHYINRGNVEVLANHIAKGAMNEGQWYKLIKLHWKI